MTKPKRSRCVYPKCGRPALKDNLFYLCQSCDSRRRNVTSKGYRRGLRSGTNDINRYAVICERMADKTRSISHADYLQAKRDIGSLTKLERERASKVLHLARFPLRFRRPATNRDSWLTYRAGVINIVLRGNYRVVG